MSRQAKADDTLTLPIQHGGVRKPGPGRSGSPTPCDLSFGDSGPGRVTLLATGLSAQRGRFGEELNPLTSHWP